ncbi:hypothetical protein [Bifidobacterium apri]|uniref:Uncharacterized protein n=1 Tax=Bifidobacterium apri TaxID=1769423 RepID=A0A6A2W0E5_9BIFI|nr:hypothetical protein [Bifidobacterium apri]KAB8301924.1 hypothetical protein DSM100238_0243 [Bifidobacterium apri]
MRRDCRDRDGDRPVAVICARQACRFPSVTLEIGYDTGHGTVHTIIGAADARSSSS